MRTGGERLGHARYRGPGHASLLRQSDDRVPLTFFCYDTTEAGISKLGEIFVDFSNG